MITLKINMIITWDYYSLTLIVWCMKLKGRDVYKDFSKDKGMFDFSNYSAYSFLVDNSSEHYE